MSELIERQQAIDAVMEYGAIWMEYTDAMDKGEIAQRALNNAKSTMIRILKELPSAQPEEKTGYWIPHIGMNHECSACGNFFPLAYFAGRPFEINYCPNCGARMKGVRQK